MIRADFSWEARERRALARLTGLLNAERRPEASRSDLDASERASHARKIVWRRLTEARAIHDRIVAGSAFEWEAARLRSLVREARAYNRVARALTPRLQTGACGLSYRAVSNRVEKDHR
jgi:hypothetical protein